MSIVTYKETQVTVRPGRDVVATMTNELRAELISLIQDAPQELVIDLAGVEIVDSVGISVLIAAHNSLEHRGGKLKIINIANDIYKLFKSMRLHNHFDIDCKQKKDKEK